MAEISKISSFRSFSEVKAQENQMKLREENNLKKKATLTKIEEILDEMGLSSLSELDEDTTKQFMSRIINEEGAEVEIEVKGDVELEISHEEEDEDEDEKEIEAGTEEEDEEEIEEGNPFIFAAGKAKATGKNEFEFNGKTYKVTLKADTGIKESYTLLINEGTRGQFGKIDNKGNITSVYTHYDSYPESMLPIIKKTFKAGKNVDFVLKNGDNSGLDKNLKKINFYGGNSNPMRGKINNIDKYIKDAGEFAAAEYVYLWDEGSKKWMMADIYKKTGLVPAFESVVTEAFYRMPEDTIENELYAAHTSLDTFYSRLKNGNDTDPKELSTIIGLLKKCERMIKKFNKPEDVKGTVYESAITEAWFGPFVFNDKMSDDELKSMYDGAIDGYAYHTKGMQYPKSDYKKAYQAIEKILKKRGISVDESVVTESASPSQMKKDIKTKEYKEISSAIDRAEEVSDIWNMLDPKMFKFTESEFEDIFGEWWNAQTGYDSLGDFSRNAMMKDAHSLYLHLLPYVTESSVNEEEINTDDEFKEYSFTVLKKAFQDDFDEVKAKEVVDGILKSSEGDYGVAIGMLVKSLG